MKRCADVSATLHETVRIGAADERPFPRAQAAGAACRKPAAEDARRGGRPGAPARPGQAAAPRVRIGQAAFDDPVGAAGRGQDHAGAADGRRVRRRIHRALGGVRRRQGHQGRGAAGPSRARRLGPAHHPVRRRSAPLQQGAAGRVPAVRRAGPGDLHRRDHRKPVVRGEQRAAVARRGLRARQPVGGGARRAVRSRRKARAARAHVRRARASGSSGSPTATRGAC